MRGVPRIGRALLAVAALTLLFGGVSAAIGWAISPVADCAPTPAPGVAAAVLALISGAAALANGLAALVTAIARRRERRLLNSSILAMMLVPVALFLDLIGLIYGTSSCLDFVL